MQMLVIFPREEYEDRVAAWEEEKAWEVFFSAGSSISLSTKVP